MSSNSTGKTPVTILSGSLGSGKTTTLEHLVPQMEEEGDTLGVVNDKDIINNDAEALNKLTEGEIGEVTVDCTCCGGQDKALDFLKEQENADGDLPYDNVFFEPTGQANSPTLLEIFDEIEGTEIDQFAHTVPVAIYDEVRTEAAHMSGLSAANTVVYTHNEAESPEERQELQDNYQLFMEDLETLGKNLEDLNFVQMNSDLSLEEFRYSSWDPGFLMDTEELGHDSFDVYSANLSPETDEELEEVIDELAETATVRRVEAYTGDRKIDVSGDQVSEKDLENPSTWRISIQYESLGTPEFTVMRSTGVNPGEDMVKNIVSEVEAEPWEIPVAAENASEEQLRSRFENHLYSTDSEAVDTAFEFAKAYDSRVDEPELVEKMTERYIQDREESIRQLDMDESVEKAEKIKYLGDILMFDGRFEDEEINVSVEVEEEVREDYGPEFLNLYEELDERNESHLESIGYRDWIENTAQRVSTYCEDATSNEQELEVDRR